MKNNDLMMFAALAAVAAYMVSKPRAATAAPPAGVGGAQEIFVPGNDNGWRYFTNGTAISPDGAYYHQGQLVWTPTS